MKLQIFCFLAILSPLGAENLFSNGGMDTAGGWKGSKKMIEEAEDGKPNRCLLVTAKKSELVTFSQEVDTKGMFKVVVKFRYKTRGYRGGGLELRGQRVSGDFTYSTRNLVADGKWHDVTWDFTQVGSSKEIEFSFSLMQGEGEVLFDDISAEGGK